MDNVAVVGIKWEVLLTVTYVIVVYPLDTLIASKKEFVTNVQNN